MATNMDFTDMKICFLIYWNVWNNVASYMMQGSGTKIDEPYGSLTFSITPIVPQSDLTGGYRVEGTLAVILDNSPKTAG